MLNLEYQISYVLQKSGLQVKHLLHDDDKYWILELLGITDSYAEAKYQESPKLG